MKPVLLDYLVCPSCHEELRCVDSVYMGEEIESAVLNCKQCNTRYPVVHGIPRFVTDEHHLMGDNVRTADAFGWEWREFTELHDVVTYETQLLDWMYPIQAEFFRDKVVLDAGCGMGRFSLVSSRFGARLVLAVDASQAVEAARTNTKELDNVQVIQADLHRLPFRQNRDAQIDFIFSIGVLHHLDVPQAGFKSLVRHLNSSGTIFAWVYGRENNGWLVKVVNPIRTLLTSRLPRTVLYGLSWMIAIMLQPILKLVYLPTNKPDGPGWLQRLLPYNDYLAWLAGFGFRHNHHVIFDHLVAPVAFYIPREEFVSWFKQEKMQVIDISWRNKNSWRGHGQFQQ